jgi:nucleoid DNA-binding protein
VQRRGSGEFSIPETGVKIRRIKKPARKSRMGRNPATGETIKIAAKPATTVVKVTALKALKEML